MKESLNWDCQSRFVDSFNLLIFLESTSIESLSQRGTASEIENGTNQDKDLEERVSHVSHILQWKLNTFLKFLNSFSWNLIGKSYGHLQDQGFLWALLIWILGILKVTFNLVPLLNIRYIIFLNFKLSFFSFYGCYYLLISSVLYCNDYLLDLGW